MSYFHNITWHEGFLADVQAYIADMQAYIADMQTYITNRLSGTFLDYWLLDREGQVQTMFFTLVIGIVIWLAVLEYSTRATKKATLATKKPAASKTIFREPAPEMIQVASASNRENPIYISSDEDEDEGDDTDTGVEIMRELAPPGHQPTNANLKADQMDNGWSYAAFRKYVEEGKECDTYLREPELRDDTDHEEDEGSDGGEETEEHEKKIVAVWANQAGKKGGRAALVK